MSTTYRIDSLKKKKKKLIVKYDEKTYWSSTNMIFSLDDLLRAGILLAENVVVVNKELSNSAEEETLADCNTIVAVQTMFK